MLNFFTGALDVAYMGSSPLALGYLYGLPVRIVGIANTHRNSAAVVRSHRPVQSNPKLGTVVGSDGQVLSHVFSQTLPESQRPMVINLSPEECISALRSGMLDFVSLWEPFVSRAVAAGGTVVFTDQDLDFPLHNYVVCTQRALDEKHDEIAAMSRAHLESAGSLASDPRVYASRLRTVFGAEIDARSYEKVIHDEYLWPTDDLLSASRLPEDVERSLATVASIHQALQSTQFASGSLARLLPTASRTSPTGSEILQLGYSNSLMCATFHVAEYEGLFEKQGLQVQAGKRRVADRIAKLSAAVQDDLRLCHELLGRDPELVIQKLGRMNEQIFRELLVRDTGEEPKSAAAVIESLRNLGAVPPEILSWADSVRSIRNVATHQAQSLDLDEAQNVFNIMLNIVEWYERHSANTSSAGKRCRRCHLDLHEDWVACPRCGTSTSAACQQCGGDLSPGWKLCPRCGCALG
jgi:ABC-type nitrate/sulfonate/bicarbonate transport system substrate-binding protein